MRTIIRNNYDPHIGDYHERIIQDEAREKTWLFDCDGVYLDITAGRGDIKVVNELGDSETDATSQKLVTDELAKKQDTLTAGENITIEGNVISAGGGNYTAGYGLTLNDTEFAADTSVLATQTDLAGKQDTLTTGQLAAVNSGIDSTKVGQIATNASDIDTIEGKIPSAATAQNQLADKSYVDTADNGLQSQIDAITASSDVKDIVGTKAELNSYDTSTLGDNDIIKVLQDESENDATTYYRWSTSTNTFTLIGEEGPYYTKSQANALLDNKVDKVTGKGLSTNDFTDALKDKLDGIEAGAEVSTIESISVNGTAVTPDGNKNVDLTIPDGVLLLDVDDHTLTADELQAFKDAWDSREPIFIHYGAVGGQIVHPQTGNTLDWTQPQTFSAIMMLRDTAVNNPKLQGATVTFTPSTMNLNLLWNSSSTLPTEGESSLSTSANGNAWVKKSAIRTALADKADNTAFTGTDGTTAGTQGLVPAPATTDAGKFLKADGTWGEAGGGIKTLTTADYNYPADAPDRVAVWLLPSGLYKAADSNVNVRRTQTGTYMTNKTALFIVLESQDGTKAIIEPLANNADRGMLVTTLSANGGVDNTFWAKTIDSLTSNLGYAPLSANQGRVLKNLIDSIAIRGAGAPTTSTVGTVGQLYEDGTNGALYQLKSIDITVTPNTYNWEQVGGSSINVVQTTGASTTSVMSQDAVSGLLFNKSGNTYELNRIRIGANAVASAVNQLSVGADAGVSGQLYAVAVGGGAKSQQYGVAVGATATTNNRGVAIGNQAGYSPLGAQTGNGSISLGAYSFASQVGQMDIGSSNTSYGYNNSNYRLLSGVYDPQNDHDAATKGYVDNAVINGGTTQPTTSTVGAVGTQYNCVNSGTPEIYICTDDTGGTYTWTKVN